VTSGRLHSESLDTADKGEEGGGSRAGFTALWARCQSLRQHVSAGAAQPDKQVIIGSLHKRAGSLGQFSDSGPEKSSSSTTRYRLPLPSSAIKPVIDCRLKCCTRVTALVDFECFLSRKSGYVICVRDLCGDT